MRLSGGAGSPMNGYTQRQATIQCEQCSKTMPEAAFSRKMMHRCHRRIPHAMCLGSFATLPCAAPQDPRYTQFLDNGKQNVGKRTRRWLCTRCAPPQLVNPDADKCSTAGCTNRVATPTQMRKTRAFRCCDSCKQNPSNPDTIFSPYLNLRTSFNRLSS